MKHILYISEINHLPRGPLVPKGLLDIYKQSKINNRVHDISGVLAYRAGYYLQVIEGDSRSVDSLYKKIMQDNRHKNISLMIEQECSSRMFAKWRFESGLDLSRNTEFRAFMNGYRSELAVLSHAEKEIVSVFYKSFLETHFEAPAFENTVLRLKQWPNLNRIGQSSELVNFCAHLIYKAYEYEELIESDKFGHNFDLNQTLSEFKDQGVLTVSKSAAAVRPTSIFVGDGFLQKMRSFLTAHH